MLRDPWDPFPQFPEPMNPLIEQPEDFQLPFAREQREGAPHFFMHVDRIAGHGLVSHTYHNFFILLAYIRLSRHFNSDSGRVNKTAPPNQTRKLVEVILRQQLRLGKLYG